MGSVATIIGPVRTEKKGYRTRLWAHCGYVGSVTKTANGTWRFAYSDGDDLQIEHAGYANRASAIRAGIYDLLYRQIVSE